MNYRIEEMESFQVIGFKKEFSAENSYQEIPKFWEELYKSYGPQSSLGQAILTFKIGEFGICNDEKEGDKFEYMIAGKYQGGVVPEGLSLFEFPKMMWAKFQCVGPLPKTLQNLNTQIFGQWLPQNKEYVMAKRCSIEWYSDGEDTQSNEYVSEIWLPIKKK